MSLSNLQYDPEYALAVANISLEVPTVFKDVFELRNVTDTVLGFVNSQIPIPEHILQTSIPFETHDGAVINLRRFSSEDKHDNDTQQPAVLYIHGGGMVSGSVDLYSSAIANYADYFDLDFFAVEYRLAPEQAGPNLTEDVFSGLKYLSEHAKEYSIDPKRIAIMGDSAGGGLAAATALLARDRALDPPIAKQVLIYPMLDDRTRLPENSAYTPFLSWTENSNELSWAAVLGEHVAGDDNANVSIYAAPGRALNLTGLPPTYIDVGQLDLFVFEDVAYANRLMEAEVEVELHVFPGLPHGFENVPNVTLGARALEARKRALQMI